MMIINLHAPLPIPMFWFSEQASARVGRQGADNFIRRYEIQAFVHFGVCRRQALHFCDHADCIADCSHMADTIV
jgi:hypothetical protein